MNATIDQAEGQSAQANRTVDTVRSPREPGPLFKDVYTGVLDVNDPAAWKPVIEKDTRSFLAHTTDIQTVDQFLSLHTPPVKRGTAFHHRHFLNGLEGQNTSSKLA
jgi:hypothetical protein